MYMHEWKWFWCQEHESALNDLARYLRLIGRSPNTVKAYINGVKIFLEKTEKSVADVSSEDAYRHLLYLKEERNLAGSTLNQRRAALRTFFTHILEKPLDQKVAKYTKLARRIPEYLSPAEVSSIFEVTRNSKYRLLFMVMYSSGLRVGEATRLTVSDIDSERMVINIRAGKGNKDRCVMLSERLLLDLRRYWQQFRPGSFFFTSSRTGLPIDKRSIQKVLKKSAVEAGINKSVTTHSLRHSFATHLLQAGTNIRYIQELLGHRSIQSTIVYLRAVPESAAAVKSPLDQLAT